MIVVSCRPATHSGQNRSDRKGDGDKTGEDGEIDHQNRRFHAFETRATAR